MKRSEAFLDVSEHLIELVAQCGIETEDTPFIQAAVRAADTLAAMLEEALQQRTITREQLFDEDYRPIPNTNPLQHTVRPVIAPISAAERLALLARHAGSDAEAVEAMRRALEELLS